MRCFRVFLLFAVLTASAVPRSSSALLWENGCLANLQSDLKRQDLAKAIGLRYFEKRPSGITRVVTERKETRAKTGKHGAATEKQVTVYDVAYFDPSGKKLSDPETIERIDRLNIPPAYTQVWISPDPESHILAIGYDSRMRPQYAYHPKWTEATAVTKFLRMEEFGLRVATVRKVTAADLQTPGLTKKRLLAAVAVILETGSIRVGSETYAEANGSYGLTTLLHSHVQVKGSRISFDFIGKEGIHHQFAIENSEVAPVIAALLQQPGPRLFEYIDEAGAARTIDAADVKKYLVDASGGGQFTAKDFRTWQGTTSAAKKLIELGPPVDAKDAEAKILEAVTYAASILRNKPNTARENYIHPLVLEAYAEGKAFRKLLDGLKTGSDASGLLPEERFVLELLRRR
jgi:DNA topoisomerase-1